jgi:uncharacterized protein (TIGR03663 family)
LDKSVTTASTKSRRNKREAEKPGKENVRPGENESTQQPAFFDLHLNWLGAGGAVLIVATFSRLYLLSINPFHHDEGVNGFFLTRLLRDHVYEYNPENYHGPTLYYFELVVAKISEFLYGPNAALTTFGARLVPALFGVATVWLVLCLRRYIGARAALIGALLLAVSPGAVYMSRYFIHESMFVFFTLGIVVAALRFYETRDLFYLIAGATCAGLLFATKETAIITVGVLLIALVCVWIYDRTFAGWLKPERRETSAGSRKRRPKSNWKGRIEELGGFGRIAIWAGIATVVFVVVNVLFYSSFFQNWKGVGDAVSALTFWSKTGQSEHAKPFYKYVQWLFQEEAGLLLLGAVGALLVFFRGRNRVVLFCALWAFGILAAYSILPYKTPWLAINFIVPLAIVSGYALDTLYRSAKDTSEKGVVAAVGIFVLVLSTVQMISLNFFHYDDEQYPYVYVHTRREYLGMIDEIDRVARLAGTQEQTSITVMAKEYWPLPWDLRQYQHVGYFGQVVNTNEALVIAEEPDEAQVASQLGERYRRIGSYRLRPGVTLVLYVRKDLPS